MIVVDGTRPHIYLESWDSGVECGCCYPFSHAPGFILSSLSHSYLANFREMLYFLQREISFVHYLELNVVIKVIGWIYCIAWIIGFYPQVCSEYVQE